MTLKIQKAMTIIASDAATRTITGRIVTWNEEGNTSWGKTLFAKDSIAPADVKLLLEHDRTRPIGRSVSMSVHAAGIDGIFKIAETTAGNDALVEAAAGLRDGFSVGISVENWEAIDGTLVIASGTLEETSLVTNPAIESARVSEVAASENIPDATKSDPDSNDQGAKMTEAEIAAAKAAELRAAEEAAAAKALTAAGRIPVLNVSLRSPITGAGSYLRQKLIAAGNSAAANEAKQFVAAADEAAAKAAESLIASSSDTTGNTGTTLPQHLAEMISTSNATTAAIDTVGRRPLIETGLSFTIPRFTVYPTVATTAENAEASKTDGNSDYITVAIVKKAGKAKVSLEMIDRSSPAYFDEIMRELRVAYGKNCDEYLLAQLAAGGTLTATTQAGTAAGLQAFIAAETTTALTAAGDFASILLSSPDWWTELKNKRDTTGRSIYNVQAGTMENSGGNVSVGSLRGEVEGLNYFVDPFLLAGSGLVDSSAYIYSPNSVRYWESPIRQIQLNNLADGSLEVELYAYVAAQVTKATGVRKFNLT